MHVSVARYLGFKPEGARRSQQRMSDVVAQATAIAGPPRKKFVPPIPIPSYH